MNPGPWLAAVLVSSAALPPALPTQALGASLRGTVTDAATQAPLARAHLVVAGTALGTTSDDRGRYELPAVPAGDCHLVVSFVGYGTQVRALRLEGSAAVQADFALRQSLLPVAGMIVTARGRPSPLEGMAGSAGVVAGREMAGQATPGIAAAAAGIPGVALGTDMPWAGRVSIRGLSRDHVVFLVDGNRVSTTSEVAAQFGTIAPADVERVEVLKGPVCVLYGTGSTGGVVNAIPVSGRFTPRPRWEVATSTSYESVAGGCSGYARAGLNTPGWYALASQSFRDYGSYADGGGRTVPNSQFRDYQTHLDLGLKLAAAHRLHLRYQWFEAADVGIPGGGEAFPAAATVRYPSTRRRLAEAQWRHDRGGALLQTFELKLYRQDVERRALVQPNQVRYQPATADQPLRRVRPRSIEPAADHDVTGGRWITQIACGAHRAVIGAEGWQKELTSRRLRVTQVDILRPDSSVVHTVETETVDRSLPHSTYRPVGIFAEDEVALARRLILTAGARLDVIRVRSERTFLTYEPPTDQVLWEPSRDTDLSWSGQVRATGALSPAARVHLTLARSFRSPGLEERFLYVDLGNTVQVGDPALDSEDGYFAEAGLCAYSARFRGECQVYYNRIAQLVVDEPATFEGRPALRKANAGKARFAGYEAALAWTAWSRLLLAGDVAHVRATDLQTKQPIRGIAPLAGHLAARYGNRTWARLGLELVADQERVAPGEAPTPGHRTAEASVGHDRLRTGGLQHRLAVGVRNLFDAEYRDHLATSRGFVWRGRAAAHRRDASKEDSAPSRYSRAAPGCVGRRLPESLPAYGALARAQGRGAGRALRCRTAAGAARPAAGVPRSGPG
ncbi:MAG: TonB-dependent receptor [Candidatus Latescibacterota bacterium]